MTQHSERLLMVLAFLFSIAACSTGVDAKLLRPWPPEVREVQTTEDCGQGRERVCSRSWVLEPLVSTEKAVAIIETHIDSYELTDQKLSVDCDFDECATVFVHDSQIYVLVSYIVGG